MLPPGREGDTHLLLQCCQVTLHALVFSLQSLHTGQVTAVVVRGEDGVLLLDPGDGLVSIPRQGEGWMQGCMVCSGLSACVGYV